MTRRDPRKSHSPSALCVTLPMRHAHRRRAVHTRVSIGDATSESPTNEQTKHATTPTRMTMSSCLDGSQMSCLEGHILDALLEVEIIRVKIDTPFLYIRRTYKKYSLLVMFFILKRLEGHILDALQEGQAKSSGRRYIVLANQTHIKKCN